MRWIYPLPHQDQKVNAIIDLSLGRKSKQTDTLQGSHKELWLCCPSGGLLILTVHGNECPLCLKAHISSLLPEVINTRTFQDSVWSQNTNPHSVFLQRVVFRRVSVEIFLEKVGRIYSSNAKCSQSSEENAKHVPINTTPTFRGLCFSSRVWLPMRLWQHGIYQCCLSTPLLFPNKYKTFG